ncbi:iron ABC transporter permease [Alteromonas sediminis]|uniref:Iron ABC transporter permease n=1 Tax=Alteromonas sediminis TaxID=2259342 RepID=A0A3N5Y6A2_9ALTE|nr:iron ABC transporter permease [Alteromonas sediminis]
MFQFGVVPVTWHIILHLQLPLVITASLVGASLASGAAALQIVLKNPLADPGIIGITSGASLSAATLILLVPSGALAYFHYWLPLACFAGAMLSTLLIARIAHKLQLLDAAVILAGIGISTVAGAIVAWLYLFSDAQAMRNLTFWLMGSLHQADWWVLAVAAPLMLTSVIVLIKQGRPLNQWYLGEMAAKSVGVNVQRFSALILVCVAVAVGAAVSVAGSVAFIGLMVPHLLRLKLGHDNRLIVPASALTGACLLLLVVCLNSLLTTTLLPVSLVTASLGGPIFLYLLVKQTRPRLRVS